MIVRDIKRLEKLQSVLELNSIADEIEMVLKLKQLFDRDLLQSDNYAEALPDYNFKMAYDVLISHIVDEISVRDVN